MTATLVAEALVGGRVRIYLSDEGILHAPVRRQLHPHPLAEFEVHVRMIGNLHNGREFSCVVLPLSVW